jgi:hypothetical protein
MEARLKEVYEDMLRPLLDQKKVMEIAVDELPGIIQVVNDNRNLTSLEPNQVRLLVKAFVLIDGSTDSFTKLNSLIKERLQALHVDPDTLNENFAPELIRLISEEEEISGLDEQPIKYREIKDIDLLKNEPDFSDFVGTSALRKRVSGLVDSLARFLKHLRKEKPTEKLVHKLKESDKKVIAAEEKLKKEQEKTKQRELAASKLAQEKAEKLLKVEMKEKARKEVEEKKRREAEEKEEKRKEEERRKEEKRKEEEKKKEEKEEERKRKEEEKKKKEEEKRLEELAQKQKKAEEDAQKEKNRVALTKFFNVLPKQGETEKQIVEEVVVEEKKCVWKKGLGCLNRTQDWNDERKQDFDDLINKLGTQILGGDSNSSKMNIEFVFDMECRLLFDSLKSQMKHLKEDAASSITCEMEEGTNDEKKKLPPRRVFIKYEDYLMDCYEYRGMFKRRSLLVTPRNPISKDEDLIDYELSSDEEFQLEEADSIHSKAGDDEEEESGNEFEEDNFVVPDGYLSEEEFGSLDEEDKSKRL